MLAYYVFLIDFVAFQKGKVMLLTVNKTLQLSYCLLFLSRIYWSFPIVSMLKSTQRFRR